MDDKESQANCIFCRILEGSAQASLLHRDEKCAVFMDIRPVNPGHLPVIPIEHAPYLKDVSSETVARMMQLAQRFAAAVRSSGVRCEGVNLFLADGEAAMQEVFHCHLHVFPRYEGDGFGLRFGPQYSVRPRDELDLVAGQILQALHAVDS